MKYDLFIVSAYLLLVCTIEKMNFEKNIFVYWETPINQAPLIIKVSLEKLQIASVRDGWSLKFITGNNIKDYLPDYERFQNVVSRGHRKTVH
jgi:hypothetical protein